MKRVFVTLVILALFPLLAGCGLLGFSEWSWHQKLVLEVETPRGTVGGGSVVRVKAGTSPKWLPGEGAGGMGSETTGEASFVEVAPGRYLFALLGNERQMALTLFFPESASDTFTRAERLETLRQTVEVPPGQYPLLVTFIDIADPTTVRRVDPDDLAATFGPGYRLKSVTLEITGEPVTEGKLEKVLPWLHEIWPNRLDGNRFGTIRSPDRFANSLSANSFSTEIGK